MVFISCQNIGWHFLLSIFNKDFIKLLREDIEIVHSVLRMEANKVQWKIVVGSGFKDFGEYAW